MRYRVYVTLQEQATGYESVVALSGYGDEPGEAVDCALNGLRTEPGYAAVRAVAAPEVHTDEYRLRQRSEYERAD